MLSAARLRCKLPTTAWWPLGLGRAMSWLHPRCSPGPSLHMLELFIDPCCTLHSHATTTLAGYGVDVVGECHNSVLERLSATAVAYYAGEALGPSICQWHHRMCSPTPLKRTCYHLRY